MIDVDDNANCKHTPDPEEIAAVCAEIRATWSPEETLRRIRPDWRPASWTAPELELAEGHGVEEWRE
ncbi:hypothetical protein Pla123a_30220 [Posidoniimonas polymericola]|uniref:Uncharacterized protein n=1 Tax=Posidoniimonas polymericola TaxID=2528002 RepID=A0A5C5YKS3_9BACT|nr:hypothetical protein [Posidoniimonas polymericola]TWT75513.1 hypothetical protein Pla123a_30220 [Posidoniimonas polymericola]